MSGTQRSTFVRSLKALPRTTPPSFTNRKSPPSTRRGARTLPHPRAPLSAARWRHSRSRDEAVGHVPPRRLGRAHDFHDLQHGRRAQRVKTRRPAPVQLACVEKDTRHTRARARLPGLARAGGCVRGRGTGGGAPGGDRGHSTAQWGPTSGCEEDASPAKGGGGGAVSERRRQPSAPRGAGRRPGRGRGGRWPRRGRRRARLEVVAPQEGRGVSD